MYHLNEDGLPQRCSGCVIENHYEDRDSAFAASELMYSGGAAEENIVTTAFKPLEGRVTSHHVVLPSGEYWFGDPSYLLSTVDEFWGDFVDATPADVGIGGAMYNNFHVVFASTLYGDGTYKGSDGFSYSVDSGTLGPIPLGLLDELGLVNIGQRLIDMGTIWSLANPVDFSISEGLITFGELLIETGE